MRILASLNKMCYFSVMELLDLFEEKIQALIVEIQRLRVENETLQDELISCRSVIKEDKATMGELTQEQQITAEVRQRIEALLHKIQNVLPQ